MGNLFLIVGSLGLLFLTFATMNDNRDPSLCTMLSLKFLCKEKSFLYKLFLRKESSKHPHSLLFVLPFFIALIINIFILVLFIIYWTFDIILIENFMNSNSPFIIGGILILIGFTYPIFLICFNKYFEVKQRKLSKEEWGKLNGEWMKYYEKFK